MKDDSVILTVKRWKFAFGGNDLHVTYKVSKMNKIIRTW